MSRKRTTRVALDVALTAMIVFEMLIQYTGVFLHEVIGFVFFATVAAHLALSAKWIKSTARTARRGAIGGKRAALGVMGVLLAVAMVALGVSSVAISSILESAGFTWPVGEYSAWATLHAGSSYALSALVTVHLAMHWTFLAKAFKVPYDPSRRRAIGAGVHATAAIGALALGVMAVNVAVPRSASTATPDGSSASAGDGGILDQQPSGEATSSDAQGSSSGASSVSSEESPRKGKHTRAIGSGADAGTAGSAAGGSSTDSSSAGAAGGQSGQGSESASGICTLCRKQCPLSAPKCDKPYAAGLI